MHIWSVANAMHMLDIYFETSSMSFEYLNGFYFKNDDRVWGDDINFDGTGCDDGIVCDPTRIYVGTYMYTHESDLYYMYEVPTYAFPVLYISDQICSNDYIIKSDAMFFLGFQVSSWVSALASESATSGGNKSYIVNDTTFDFQDTETNTTEYSFLTWYLDDDNTQTIQVIEFCDFDDGLGGPCLATNYTFEPTINRVTNAPTNEPSFPSMAPSLPSLEPTQPTFEPTNPTFAPSPPTFEPTIPTLIPTNVPTAPSSIPTNNPSDRMYKIVYNQNKYSYTRTYTHIHTNTYKHSKLSKYV